MKVKSALTKSLGSTLTLAPDSDPINRSYQSLVPHW